jgi:hypothetical protein
MERILAEIQVIKADILVIKTDIQVIKDDIRDIKEVRGHVSPLILPLITHSRNHNLSVGAGDDARLEIVPFTNGRDPTKAQ